MNTPRTVFSRINRIYENVRLSRLTRHEIEFQPAARILQTSSRLFQMLDHADPVQADISRRLWVLRSSILFTVLQFNDPILRLQGQSNELEQSSRGLPDTTQLMDSLKKQVAEIVNVSVNPKREWLLNKILENHGSDGGQIGVLCALSAGRSPGWPPDRTDQLLELSDGVVLIGSRRQLRSCMFETVVLPCACKNAPPALLSELLFSGFTAKLDVLVYSGEKFHIPKRLMLPSDGIFEGRVQKTEIETEAAVVSCDSALSAVDTWMNEAFWQGIHGAARSSSQDSVPANYILFCDGTGTFLPTSGRILALPAEGLLMDASDLCMVPVDDVSEGDLVVLRSGDSGFLLDDTSDRIMNSAGNESLFETATDWKMSLEALLVTHSYQEVAQALRERGAATSAASIHQWVGPEVLGPGDQLVFRELINLLAEKGKINKVGVELINYADSRWNALKDLRGVRQKAGNQIRHDLLKALFTRIGNGCGHLADGEHIHIEGDTGAELLILRVSSVDRNASHVPPARLGQVDDLKGNRWLG